jgi:hypothetical protein
MSISNTKRIIRRDPAGAAALAALALLLAAPPARAQEPDPKLS